MADKESGALATVAIINLVHSNIFSGVMSFALVVSSNHLDIPVRAVEDADADGPEICLLFSILISAVNDPFI